MAKIDEIFRTTSDNGSNGSLGIDKDGNLYWNKKRVLTKQKLRLDFWVNFSIFLTAFATLGMFAVAVLEYLWPLGC